MTRNYVNQYIHYYTLSNISLTSYKKHGVKQVKEWYYPHTYRKMNKFHSYCMIISYSYEKYIEQDYEKSSKSKSELVVFCSQEDDLTITCIWRYSLVSGSLYHTVVLIPTIPEVSFPTIWMLNMLFINFLFKIPFLLYLIAYCK